LRGNQRSAERAAKGGGKRTKTWRIGRRGRIGRESGKGITNQGMKPFRGLEDGNDLDLLESAWTLQLGLEAEVSLSKLLLLYAS